MNASHRPEAALRDNQLEPARPLSLDIATESAWLRLSNRSSNRLQERFPVAARLLHLPACEHADVKIRLPTGSGDLFDA